MWATEKNPLNVSAISNLLTINLTLKAIANKYVQKLQNMETIFKKEMLCKDTSDTPLVRDSAKKLKSLNKY